MFISIIYIQFLSKRTKTKIKRKKENKKKKKENKKNDTKKI
jgi:hypothetical protein